MLNGTLDALSTLAGNGSITFCVVLTLSSRSANGERLSSSLIASDAPLSPMMTPVVDRRAFEVSQIDRFEERMRGTYSADDNDWESGSFTFMHDRSTSWTLEAAFPHTYRSDEPHYKRPRLTNTSRGCRIYLRLKNYKQTPPGPVLVRCWLQTSVKGRCKMTEDILELKRRLVRVRVNYITNAEALKDGGLGEVHVCCDVYPMQNVIPPTPLLTLMEAKFEPDEAILNITRSGHLHSPTPPQLMPPQLTPPQLAPPSTSPPLQRTNADIIDAAVAAVAAAKAQNEAFANAHLTSTLAERTITIKAEPIDENEHDHESADISNSETEPSTCEEAATAASTASKLLMEMKNRLWDYHLSSSTCGQLHLQCAEGRSVKVSHCMMMAQSQRAHKHWANKPHQHYSPTLKVGDCSIGVLEQVAKYISQGQVEISPNDVDALYRIAIQLECDSLCADCIPILKQTMTIENAIKRLIEGVRARSSELKHLAIDYLKRAKVGTEIMANVNIINLLKSDTELYTSVMSYATNELL